MQSKVKRKKKIKKSALISGQSKIKYSKLYTLITILHDVDELPLFPQRASEE